MAKPYAYVRRSKSRVDQDRRAISTPRGYRGGLGSAAQGCTRALLTPHPRSSLPYAFNPQTRDRIPVVHTKIIDSAVEADQARLQIVFLRGNLRCDLGQLGENRKSREERKKAQRGVDAYQAVQLLASGRKNNSRASMSRAHIGKPPPRHRSPPPPIRTAPRADTSRRRACPPRTSRPSHPTPAV